MSLVLGGAAFANETPDLPEAISAIAYIGLGPTLLGNIGDLPWVTVLGPQRAAAFIYLSLVFSAVLSVIWAGEVLHSYHLIGFALVAGLILVNLDQRQPASVPQEERSRQVSI